MITKIAQHVGLILSPPACAGCKKRLSIRTVFCEDCDRRLLQAMPVMLQVTSKISIMVYAAYIYQEPIRLLVLQKRWNIVAGSYALAELIWQKTVFENLSCDVLVPVPLHWTRFLMRGFNQSKEIAEILAHKKGCACADLLRRTKHTAYQSELPIEQRAANVRGVFALRSCVQKYAGKHLVLVDDLMTTGNTLRSAAKELLALKPSSLTIFVACRVPVKSWLLPR